MKPKDVGPVGPSFHATYERKAEGKKTKKIDGALSSIAPAQTVQPRPLKGRATVLRKNDLGKLRGGAVSVWSESSTPRT